MVSYSEDCFHLFNFTTTKRMNTVRPLDSLENQDNE